MSEKKFDLDYVGEVMEWLPEAVSLGDAMCISEVRLPGQSVVALIS